MDAPPADVLVTAAIVRELLADQAPALADRALRHVASGWDNVIYRSGDDLAVRLPRRAVAGQLIRHERLALAAVGADLPLPVPVPLVEGRPTTYYPHHWAVVPWLPGRPAVEAPPTAAGTAEDLAAFMVALHQPAPAHAPGNPYRGIPLSERLERTTADLDVVAARGSQPPETVARARAVVERSAAAPEWPGTKRWVHGDLHARNVLVAGGRISGVLDFGDVHAGDPAVDLIAAWYLLPVGRHAVLRHRAGVDDHTWARGRGWAVAHAAAVLAGAPDDAPFVTAASSVTRAVVGQVT